MLDYIILATVRTLLFLRACLVAFINWLISPFTLLKSWLLSSIAAGHKKRHMTRLQQTLATTEDYQTWWITAKRLDMESGYGVWSEDNRCPLYDADALSNHIRDLQRWLAHQDPQLVSFHLRSVLHRNLTGMSQEVLFPYYCGTKKLLEQYVVQVINSIEFIYGSQSLTLADRVCFFRDTLQSYGRTALILSGGSALGLYHLGIMKALSDAEMLPHIICGTELGACLAALVCTRTEKQMVGLFTLHDVNMDNYERLKHDRAAIRARLSMFFHEGSLVDVVNLKAFMIRDFGDITFKEAYHLSERVLNVTVWNVPGAPVVFNHMTTPNVVVWSAVCMSINPNPEKGIQLMAKHRNGVLYAVKIPEQRWHRRGQPLAVVADTPTAPLCELFDVNFHIVSQVQAHIVPGLLLKPTHPAMYRTRSFFARVRAKVLYLALQEAHHQFAQLLKWLCVPNDSNLQIAMTQSYEGHVTIVPVGTFEDYLAVLHVPSKEHTEQCLVSGCRRAWPSMTIVMYHCLIERRLEKCLADLKVAMRISDEAIQIPHTPTATHLTPQCSFSKEEEAHLSTEQESAQADPLLTNPP